MFSGRELTFRACDVSASTTICGLTKCPIDGRDIPLSIAFDQGTCFVAKEVQYLVTPKKLSNILYHLEVAGLFEGWNGL